MSDVIETTDPSYNDAVALALRLRVICWYLLEELGRHNFPKPATQAELQALEAQHPWLAWEDPKATEERLTEAEWLARNR